MIGDILVHIPTEHPQRPVVDASVSLAASFGAHLDAIAIGYICPATTFVPDPGGAAAVGAVFEAERAPSAATELAIFETEARNAGIAYATHPDRRQSWLRKFEQGESGISPDNGER